MSRRTTARDSGARDGRRPSRLRRILVLGTLTAAAAAAVLIPVAEAATPPHAPFGSFDSLRQVASGIAVSGWAIDPDTTAPIHVDVYADGKGLARLVAGNPRPDLAGPYPGRGTNHGFAAQFSLPAGAHNVCAFAINVGPGNNVLLACRSITVLANPFGSVDNVAQSGDGFNVSGWDLDPNTTAPIFADVYVDGSGLARLTANGNRPDIAGAFPGYGAAHGFAAHFPMNAGSHNICVFAINVGPGSNQLLSCTTLTINFNPFGSLDGVTQVPNGVTVSGWTIDPNQPATSLAVQLTIDGKAATSGVASGSRPDVARVYPGAGAAHGYQLSAPTTQGSHTFCVTATNVGLGQNSTIGCRQVNLDFNPRSGIDVLQQRSPGAYVSGWSIDPDTSDPVQVKLTVDGGAAGTVTANGNGSHGPHQFSATVTAGNGAHTICAAGVNLLDGSGAPTPACATITLNFNPFGSFDSVNRAPGSTAVVVGGWTIDPDTAQPISISVTLDGAAAGTATANVNRPDVGRAYPSFGSQHGFLATFPANDGEHKLCVTAINVGTGNDTSLGCRIINAVHPVPPSAPTNAAAVGGYGGATVSWTASSSDGGAPVSGYTVVSSPGGVTVNTASDTTQATVVGLQPKTAYTFAVYANNVAGRSATATTPAVTTQAAPPPQTSPAPISTSRYVRNVTGASSGDLATMRSEGAADAAANPSGHGYLILLDIGGQDQADGGVILSATTQFVSYRALVADVQAYVDGYASQQRPSAPVTIAIGTNNDMDVSAASGATWAGSVVNPVASYATKYSAITVAGANDIEPGFLGNYAQSRAWLQGYLGATGRPFVFNGSADGCSWTTTSSGCNNGWTMSGLYYLSGGAAPTRIINLPQVYNNTMAQQWKYISLTGVGQNQPRINFGGALTEFTACAQTGGCGSLTGNSAWSSMWSQLQSSPALRVDSLPYSTDLRIDR